MRVALTAIAFVAVMLLSACVQPYDPAAFAGWSRERAVNHRTPIRGAPAEG